MRKLIFLNLLLFAFFWPLRAQHNAVETFTAANGLGNNGCSDLLMEANGTLWVGHDNYSAPSLNGKPFSRRMPNGTWDYPFNSAGLPAVTVSGSPYSWASFSVHEIHQTNNGAIWFIPNTPNSSDMNNAPPLLVYHNSSFSVYHISLANFPNKGAVHTMLEDNYGHLWFGCEEGLVKLDANTNQFSTYDPPVVNFNGLANPHTSKRVFELDYDANNRILMLTGHVNNIIANSSLFRVFTPLTNTWESWSHLDAPWRNATQAYYHPANILATRDGANRVYVSSFGGGIYYIDNSDWSSHTLHQIADFVRGWSYPAYTFENIYTNLPDFTRKLYADPDTGYWTLGIDGNAYRKMYEVPTTFSGNPATYHLFGYKESQITYNNNGSIDPSPYQAMAFYQNEIWISSQHGLERWYYDSLNPGPSYIAVEGVGARKQGVAGFNTKTNNALEAQKTGHTMPTSWPSISIDTAYYYLATSDYENINPGINAGIKGNGAYAGFSATAAALSAHGYTFSDLELRFSAIGLDKDTRDTDWLWDNNKSKEIRFYKEIFNIRNGTVSPTSFYEILLDGHVLFKGRMPDFQLHLAYNKYGYLFDSIGGYSDPAALVPYPNITDPKAADVKDSLLADIDGKSIEFVFRTIQTALNEEIRTVDRRGGIYQVFDAYLRKADVVTAIPPIPMCGDYTIGQTVNADYSSFSAAIADLHLRGVVCDVNFIVGKGNYVEQVEIGEYEGMNHYRVSFLGQGSGAELSYSPAHVDSNYVVKITGTPNLSFKDLRFENNQASFGRIFALSGSTANFILDSCELTGLANAANTPLNTKTRYYLFSCSDCDDLKIRYNTFTGGSNAIEANGTVLSILHNEFEGNTGTAINLNSANSIRVENNLILGPATGNYNGISFSGYPFQILNNQILNSTANCINAIYSSNFSTGNVNNPARIWNNEISVSANTGYGSGILVACGYVTIYYNSINVMGNNANFVGLQNFFAPSTWVARNNIVVNPNGICFYTSRSDAGQAYADSDYNLFYSNTANPFQTMEGFASEVDHANLAAFQTASSREANSLFLDPQFATNDHLLPLNPAASENGTPLANINDRLGRARSAVSPDQGCYEFDGMGWTGNAGADWRNPLNWSGLKVPTRNDKVFVSPRNNHPVIDTSIEVRDFVLHRSAQMRIRANAGLRVDSLLENSGSIVLEADTNGGYARLIQGQISGGGRITQEAVLRAADTSIRWFHLGVPVRTKVRDLANAQTYINAGPNGGSIYFWNASEGKWECPRDTAAYLEPGIGYAVAAGENAYGNFLITDFPATIDVSGPLRSADSVYHLDLAYTSVPQFNSYVSLINDGWNFLANPYHAVYDMQGQSIPGAYKTVYVWNGTTYKQYNTQLDAGDAEARYLAPLQGFFIRTDSLQSLSGFNFDPAQRSLSSVQEVQKTALPRFSLSVKAQKGSQSDRCYVVLHPSAQKGFEEEYDAAKLKNAGEHLNFYTYAQNNPVAINTLSEQDLLQGIELGFEAPMDGQFSIGLSADAPQDYAYFLRDKLLDKIMRIDLAEYQFAHQVQNFENRFELFVIPQAVDLQDSSTEGAYFYWENGQLYFEQLPLGSSDWQLISLDGKEVARGTKTAENTALAHPTAKYSPGIYLFQFPDLALSFKVFVPKK